MISVYARAQRPVSVDLLLMALFFSFGGRSSIKTSSSSSYSDASRLSSLGSSPFELISEYHSGKLPLTDRSLFEFSSHVVWHNTTHAGIMPYHMADWKISGALGTGRSEVNRTRVIDHRWYGSIPHGASELLIGPLHRNRHVTCGKQEYSLSVKGNKKKGVSIFRKKESQKEEAQLGTDPLKVRTN